MTQEQKKLLIYIGLIVAAMFIVTFLYVFSTSTPVGQDNESGISVSDQPIVNTDSDLINVLTSVGATDMAGFLNSADFVNEIENAEQNITLFVPANIAFTNEIDDSNKFTKSHILVEQLYSNTLQAGVPYVTSFGNNVMFDVENGELFVTGNEQRAKVLAADIFFEKGTIILIDSFLISK